MMDEVRGTRRGERRPKPSPPVANVNVQELVDSTIVLTRVAICDNIQEYAGYTRQAFGQVRVMADSQTDGLLTADLKALDSIFEPLFKYHDRICNWPRIEGAGRGSGINIIYRGIDEHPKLMTDGGGDQAAASAPKQSGGDNPDPRNNHGRKTGRF